MEVTTVPVIVASVYLIMYLFKLAFNGREKLIRIIPIIAAVLGAALSVIIYYFIPSIKIADNILTAVLIGASSGLAATGTHQIFKQLTKNKGNSSGKDAGINKK